MKPRRALLQALAPALAVLLLAGCATPPAPPQPRTTVTLLPDEDGRVGAVLLSNGAGTQRVDQAYAAATAVGAASAPTVGQPQQEAAVTAAHAELLKAQPPRPVTFVLTFVLDKTVLTEAAKAQLPALLAAVRERKPTEISVFGHADSTGSKERNLRLSADRARTVADWLRKSDESLDRIEVKFFGDAEPLVPAAPGVPEPRNRRAEVMVL